MAKKKAGTLTMAVNVPANSPNPQWAACTGSVASLGCTRRPTAAQTSKKFFFFFSFYRTSIKAQNIYTSILIFLLLKNTRYTHIGSTYLTLKKEKEKRRRTCVLWFSFVVQMVQCEG